MTHAERRTFWCGALWACKDKVDNKQSQLVEYCTGKGARCDTWEVSQQSYGSLAQLTESVGQFIYIILIGTLKAGTCYRREHTQFTQSL